MRLVITAGPTHEPIDAVRFLGNRSSGQLGIALAEAASARGWRVTLLLGPTPHAPSDSQVKVRRFRTTADLERLLAEELPNLDVLVMAAAVADYRPALTAEPGEKFRREPGGLTLHLEATPDLLAGCAARRKAGQVLVGFALEPRARLLASAADKLARKGIDLLVANPLETMDSDRIEAWLLSRTGPTRATPGVIAKPAFAVWLVDCLNEAVLAAGAGEGRGSV